MKTKKIMCLLTMLLFALCLFTQSAFAIGAGSDVDFRDETVYSILVPRFYDGDPSNNIHAMDDAMAGNTDEDPAFRGDFKGISKKLDYIKALGFSTICLSPVAKSCSGYDYDGTAPVNFQAIDRRFESQDYTYEDLISDCHARGIRVIQEVHFGATSNFGEENLCHFFDVNETGFVDHISQVVTPTEEFLTLTGIGTVENYLALPPYEQLKARFGALRGTEPYTNCNLNEIYHRETSMGYETAAEQQGTIAGDYIDLNTENPIVAQYIAETMRWYARMGVDAIYMKKARYVNRWTYNEGIIPMADRLLKEENLSLQIFAEIEARVREVWNHNIPSSSVPFFTWKETDSAWMGNWNNEDPLANVKTSIEHYNAHTDPSQMPTSANALLNGLVYHAPDNAQSSRMHVLDFMMLWNFESATYAMRAATQEDPYMQDSTWNLIAVDTENYGPDGMSNVRFCLGTQSWKENLALSFFMRGIPMVQYGSEINFQAGLPLNMGANMPLAQTGRAYFGENLDGDVQSTGFGVFYASGNVDNNLKAELSKHIRKLNGIRAAVPALRKGQYTTDESFVNGDMAFIKRYTDNNVDSLALVAISSGATFNNIPNGRYIDANTGEIMNVSNGVLVSHSLSKGDYRVWVCCAPGFFGIDGAIAAGGGAGVRPDSSPFKLSFVPNGGTGQMSTVSGTFSQRVVLPDCGFTAPEGKAFKAWEIDGKSYLPQESVFCRGDMEAKALWEDICVYGIIIDDTEITNQNAADVFGDGKVSFDQQNLVLRLCDVSIGKIISNIEMLSIHISGTVQLSGADVGIYAENGSISIDGNGTLCITAKASAICAQKTVFVNDIILTASAKNSSTIQSSSIVLSDSIVSLRSEQAAAMSVSPDTAGYTKAYRMMAGDAEYIASENDTYKEVLIRTYYTATFYTTEGGEGTKIISSDNGLVVMPEAPAGDDFIGWTQEDQLYAVGDTVLLSEDLDFVATFGSSTAGGLDIFFKPAGWLGDMYAFLWGDTGTMSNWPGMRMEPVEDGIYKITQDKAYAMIIFNNGSSQTADLSIPTDGRNLYDMASNTWITYGTAPSLTKENIVSFAANGGLGYMSSVLLDADTYALPYCTFSAPLYKTFGDWQVGNTLYKEGDIIEVSGAVVITPVWENVYSSFFEVFSHTNEDGKTKAYINFPTAGSYSVIFADFEGGRLQSVTVKTQAFTMGVNEVVSDIAIALSDGDVIMAIDTFSGLAPLGDAYMIGE